MNREPKDFDRNQENTLTNVRCNGLNCFNTSTKDIEVSAGIYGKINLSLCEKCASLFKVKEKDEVYNKPHAV